MLVKGRAETQGIRSGFMEALRWDKCVKPSRVREGGKGERVCACVCVCLRQARRRQQLSVPSPVASLPGPRQGGPAPGANQAAQVTVVLLHHRMLTGRTCWMGSTWRRSRYRAIARGEPTVQPRAQTTYLPHTSRAWVVFLYPAPMPADLGQSSMYSGKQQVSRS